MALIELPPITRVYLYPAACALYSCSSAAPSRRSAPQQLTGISVYLRGGHTDNGTLFIQPYPQTSPPPAHSGLLTEDLIHRTAGAAYPHVSQLTANDGRPVIVPAGAVVRALTPRRHHRPPLVAARLAGDGQTNPSGVGLLPAQGAFEHCTLKAFGFVLCPLQPLACGASFILANPKGVLSGVVRPPP